MFKKDLDKTIISQQVTLLRGLFRDLDLDKTHNILRHSNWCDYDPMNNELNSGLPKYSAEKKPTLTVESEDEFGNLKQEEFNLQATTEDL